MDVSTSPALLQAADQLHSVFRTLNDTNAQLERFVCLGDHLAAAVWHRKTDEDETCYNHPGHHTLSFYLNGGEETERERVPRYGAPQYLCTLPGEHESRWWVRGELRFLHLYFLPEHFTQRAVQELDREPRELTLADRTYFEHPQLAAACQQLVQTDWQHPDGLLQANGQAHDILSMLLRSQSALRAPASKGGLSVAVRRRLADYIDAQLQLPLTLGQLAAEANLSEFHLARMFKVSFGMTPQQWISARRLELARTLLQHSDLPLEQVAQRCGYADASHFSHRFKASVGTSPGQYRQSMRSPRFLPGGEA